MKINNAIDNPNEKKMCAKDEKQSDFANLNEANEEKHRIYVLCDIIKRKAQGFTFV